MKKKEKTKKEIKREKVESLGEKIEKAKTIAFANYHGLSSNQLNDLRAKIKENGGEFLVEKVSLIKLALKKKNLELEETLQGPTAAIFSFQDEIAPIKDVSKINKEIGIPQFKFGFFNKNFINQGALENLAQIPTKDVLLENLVGSLASPIYGIVGVLGANLRNLVYALDQIKTQKGSAND